MRNQLRAESDGPRDYKCERVFSLDVNLDPLNEYAWDVIRSIERPKIDVINPGDEHEWDSGMSEYGSISVPLMDWLAVGCQRIRWVALDEEQLGDRVCGVYSHNAYTVFGYSDEELGRHGPAVYVGEILLPKKILNAWHYCGDSVSCTEFIQAFQLIIAHELVHVFNMIKYLVPAVKDWQTFCEGVLGDDSATESFYRGMKIENTTVDDYGQEGELESIRAWWPSRADEWWKARPRFDLFANHSGQDTTASLSR